MATVGVKGLKTITSVKCIYRPLPKMVNGSRYYRALESVSFVYRSYHLPMPDPRPSTLTV